MSKPLPSQTLFSPQSPPWNLTQLDANLQNVWAALNDTVTYANFLIDTGAVNALVATTAAGVTFSLVAGVSFELLVANTTTAPASLNVNGTGSVTLTDMTGAPLVPGDLNAGSVYRILYDGTVYRVITPFYGSGTFTAVGTGFSGAAPSCPVNWAIAGNVVTIDFRGFSGPSNATTFTITGWPAVIQPTTAQNSTVLIAENNTVATLALMGVFSAAATMYVVTVGGVGNGVNSSGWTASGTKGLAACSFSYNLL